jgi:ribose 5-phosphate isomerase B
MIGLFDRRSLMSDIVAIAADHGGFDLKESLVPILREAGLTVLDLGTTSRESVDYPEFADALAAALNAGRARRGVLICGTGIGISIAANRHPGIRAALCHDGLTARLARQHNDANVLVLGGRVIGIETAKDCLTTFLDTPFEGGRHARRVAKLGRAVVT